jgi:hypothetical protein
MYNYIKPTVHWNHSLDYLEEFEKLLIIKRYSYRTIKSHLHALKSFFRPFKGTNPENGK